MTVGGTQTGCVVVCVFVFCLFWICLFIILVIFCATLGGTRGQAVWLFSWVFVFLFVLDLSFFYSCDFCRTLGDYGVVFVCICLFV